MADITRLEPTIIGKGFLVEIVTLVIALGDTTATQPDFTLRRIVARQVSSFGVVFQLDFHRGDDDTHATKLHTRRLDRRRKRARAGLLTWKNSGVKMAHMPHVSVAPYPCRVVTSVVVKKSCVALLRAAPVGKGFSSGRARPTRVRPTSIHRQSQSATGCLLDLMMWQSSVHINEPSRVDSLLQTRPCPRSPRQEEHSSSSHMPN